MVLLRIQTAVLPMTGIEGFKYQASDGFKEVYLPYFILPRLRCNWHLAYLSLEAPYCLITA